MKIGHLVTASCWCCLGGCRHRLMHIAHTGTAWQCPEREGLASARTLLSTSTVLNIPPGQRPSSDRGLYITENLLALQPLFSPFLLCCCCHAHLASWRRVWAAFWFFVQSVGLTTRPWCRAHLGSEVLHHSTSGLSLATRSKHMVCYGSATTRSFLSLHRILTAPETARYPGRQVQIAATGLDLAVRVERSRAPGTHMKP